MFKKGKSSVTLNEVLSKVSEGDILSHYLGITHIPTIISSPLRKDKNPSFGLYSKDGINIKYIDLSTKERGGLFDLLEKLWDMTFNEVLDKIYTDMILKNRTVIVKSVNKCSVVKYDIHKSDIKILCKVRDWKDYDIAYWESYGINLKWLKYAEIYPISHKIIEKSGRRYTFGADKYAYAYIERKEGNVSIKIYQPFNRDGYKWSNAHDGSVISLWAKVPEHGDKLCICSSVKDALCLWANTGIPAIAPQGEGYKLSDTAINELKKRFKNIYIMFDNDSAGILDGKKLAEETGFINLILPKIGGKKDISDVYQYINNKTKFKQTFLKLFENYADTQNLH